MSLGALTNVSSELQATPYASELAELPLHPRLAHLLRGAADGSERALAIGCAAAQASAGALLNVLDTDFGELADDLGFGLTEG